MLHDPTREKQFKLGPPDDTTVLNAIPDSVKTQAYQGKTYFPNLPPHLAERFFLDPNRGANGALVFNGQFVDAPVGDKYLLLNVLGPARHGTTSRTCASPMILRKARWNVAIDGLATKMELFVENPAKPGTYIPASPVPIGPSAVAEVANDDVAVDSYALTAVGPGVGYVTLIVGNRARLHPVAEPVTVYIIKVVDTLYRGEVNVIESSNPLNEKLTLQQVVDLAGKAERLQIRMEDRRARGRTSSGGLSKHPTSAPDGRNLGPCPVPVDR